MERRQFLTTIDGAVQWTGRPAGTIWRWASEGRIRTYGHGRGRVRYDLAELEPKAIDGTPCPTPPKRASLLAAACPLTPH